MAPIATLPLALDPPALVPHGALPCIPSLAAPTASEPPLIAEADKGSEPPLAAGLLCAGGTDDARLRAAAPAEFMLRPSPSPCRSSSRWVGRSPSPRPTDSISTASNLLFASPPPPPPPVATPLLASSLLRTSALLIDAAAPPLTTSPDPNRLPVAGANCTFSAPPEGLEPPLPIPSPPTLFPVTLNDMLAAAAISSALSLSLCHPVPLRTLPAFPAALAEEGASRRGGRPCAPPSDDDVFERFSPRNIAAPQDLKAHSRLCRQNRWLSAGSCKSTMPLTRVLFWFFSLVLSL